jgi:hypothetical protein
MEGQLPMKNITVPVNDETYLQTRAWAAMHGTSVSALIKKIREKHAFNSQPPPSPPPHVSVIL